MSNQTQATVPDNGKAKRVQTLAIVNLNHIKVDPKVNARGFHAIEVDVNDPEIVALAATIKEDGLLHALEIVPLEKPHGDFKYLLVAGFRRIAACRIAGMTEAPCTVLPYTSADSEKVAEVNLLENVARDDLSDAELAYGLSHLKDTAEKAGHKLTNEALALKVGDVSKQHVANLVRAARTLIPDVAMYWRGDRKNVALRMDTVDAFRFAGKDADEQKAMLQAWLDAQRGGAEGEAPAAGDGGEAAEAAPKMPKRDKVEAMLDCVRKGKDVEALRMGGKWVPFEKVSQEERNAILSFGRWLLNPKKTGDFVKMVEEDEEEDEK